jgi:hypothetical protein
MICLNKLFSPETSYESTELEREGKGKGEITPSREDVPTS